jgi:hypothetical protein
LLLEDGVELVDAEAPSELEIASAPETVELPANKLVETELESEPRENVL